MPSELLPLGIGFLFGASLLLSGLADPDRIIGTLRLKDFHAMRTIAVFVIVGMLGTWLLALGGEANLGIKPAQIVVNLVGGVVLGIGFGLTGYCPGTGLACAVAGRLDALVTVVGMFLGALAYILVYPAIVPSLESLGDYGKATLPQITGTDPAWWVLPIVAAATFVLWLTRPRRGAAESQP
jgi:uncharacterized membrane protein YedE/YeeE